VAGGAYGVLAWKFRRTSRAAKGDRPRINQNVTPRGQFYPQFGLTADVTAGQIETPPRDTAGFRVSGPLSKKKPAHVSASRLLQITIRR
jgi:hypothetical protein